MMLTSREQRIFDAFAHVVLEPGDLPGRALSLRVAQFLDRCTISMRVLFRSALFLLEWGTLFLRTGSGRFEHFSRLPSAAKRRYVRLWMNHKVTIFRQLFALLRMLTLAAYYDDRAESARLGYAPRWMC